MNTLTPHAALLAAAEALRIAAEAVGEYSERAIGSHARYAAQIHETVLSSHSRFAEGLANRDYQPKEASE
jgi:hypothetical protein